MMTATQTFLAYFHIPLLSFYHFSLFILSMHIFVYKNHLYKKLEAHNDSKESLLLKNVMFLLEIVSIHN